MISGILPHRLLGVGLGAVIISMLITWQSFAQRDAGDKYARYEEIVAETHAASLALRKRALTNYLNTDPDTRFPNIPKWGSTLWSMVALYLNERTDEANQVILDLTNAYLPKYRSGEISPVAFKPEAGKNLPFSFFAVPEYVRILYMFGESSRFYPGRLKPETEKAMMDFMWIIVSEKSKVAETGPERLLVYQGTENHDILRRPYFYLMNHLFMNDPEYRDRLYKDGFKAKDHYEAYNKYFLARPGMRAMAGHWVEAGSDRYQKYTPPTILNMAELAPDPLVRKRYKMLLDLMFIEDAQISVEGRRGGGRSRAQYARNPWELTKWMMYGVPTGRLGSSHNKIFETSTYQLPASAILLRKTEFPVEQPFEIINRVIGEMEDVEYERDEDARNAFKRDGKHLNYAYRTPHYLIGGYLQNPSLKYHGIAKQNRWGGMIFDHPDARYKPGTRASHPIHISAVYPWYSKARENRGRPQHPLWGINHKNVMIVQRIPHAPKGGGSYNTGAVYIRFFGDMLEKTEKGGWIFASDGNAFVGVKFLDDGYTWNDARDVANPKKHHPGSNHRYLLHAGDIQAHGTLDAFMDRVLENRLLVKDGEVRYSSQMEGIDLTMFTYDPSKPEAFKMPVINGSALDLSPAWTYKSPYINSAFKEKVITVTVGPVKEIYDFGD